MNDELVTLGKAADFSRFNTNIENVLALHGRVPVVGQSVDQCTTQMALVFRCPGEGYESIFPIDPNDLDKFARERKIPFVEDKGYDYKKLIGEPVSAYYLHRRLIGWEVRDEVLK